MFTAQNRQRTFSIVAGICFAILAFSNLFVDVLYLAFGYYDLNSAMLYEFIHYTSVFAGFAVLAFIQQKKLPFTIVAGVNALFAFFHLVLMDGDMLRSIGGDAYAWAFGFTYANNFFVCSVLFLMALATCIPALHKKLQNLRYVCFIPSAVLLLNSLIITGSLSYQFGMYSSIRSYVPASALSGLVEIAAVLFAALWLMGTDEREVARDVKAEQPAPVSNSAPKTTFTPHTYVNNNVSNTNPTPYAYANNSAPRANPTPYAYVNSSAPGTNATPYMTANNPTPASAPNSAGSVSGVDKLVEYKKLLDAGLITQEDFDAKKKQVLDLYF